jgi:Fe-S-cluster containining protein
MLHIWKEQGNVTLIRLDPLRWQVVLGLQHNPCPFLSDRNATCTIHSHRPVNCALFPAIIEVGDAREKAFYHATLPCLHEVELSTPQKTALQDMLRGLPAKARGEMAIWGSPIIVQLSMLAVPWLIRSAEEARAAAGEIIPHEDLFRTACQRLREVRSPDGRELAADFQTVFSSILYTLHYRRIAAMLAGLTPPQLQALQAESDAEMAAVKRVGI